MTRLSECFPTRADGCALEQFVGRCIVRELLGFRVPFERGAWEQHTDVSERAVSGERDGVVKVRSANAA